MSFLTSKFMTGFFESDSGNRKWTTVRSLPLIQEPYSFLFCSVVVSVVSRFRLERFDFIQFDDKNEYNEHDWGALLTVDK